MWVYVLLRAGTLWATFSTFFSTGQSCSSKQFFLRIFSAKFLASGLFCPLVPLPHKQQLVHVPVWFQQAPRWQPLQPQESSARRGKGRPFVSGFQGVKRQVKTNNYSSFFGGSILLAKSWYWGSGLLFPRLPPSHRTQGNRKSKNCDTVRCERRDSAWFS